MLPLASGRALHLGSGNLPTFRSNVNPDRNYQWDRHPGELGVLLPRKYARRTHGRSGSRCLSGGTISLLSYGLTSPTPVIIPIIWCYSIVTSMVRSWFDIRRFSLVSTHLVTFPPGAGGLYRSPSLPRLRLGFCLGLRGNVWLFFVRGLRHPLRWLLHIFALSFCHLLLRFFYLIIIQLQ